MKTAALIVSVCVLLGSLGFLGYKYIDMERSLEGTRKSLEKARGEIDNFQRKIEVLRNNLTYTEALLSQLRDNLENTENRLAIAKAELEELKEGTRFNLHNPLYKEVQNFLEEDKTDQHEYIEGDYVCVDYASDVNNNAEEEGIRCAFVDIRFGDGAHAIVAFQTIDKGLIYVEPQEDVIITTDLRAGQEYYEVLDRYTDTQVVGPPNDTIRRIALVW